MKSSESDVDILLKHHKKRDLALMVVKLKKETVVAMRAVAKCKFILQKMQLIMGENDVQYSEDCSSSTELVEELSSSTELVEFFNIKSSPIEVVEELSELENTHNNSSNSRTALAESIIAEFDKPFIDSPNTSNCKNLIEATSELNTQESAPKKRKINPVKNFAAYKKASSEMLCINSHVLYAPPSVNIPPLHLRDPRRPVSKKYNLTDPPMRLPVPQYQSRQVPTERQNGLNASTSNEQVPIDPNSAEVKVENMLLTSHNVEQNYIQNELTEKHLEHTLPSNQISEPHAENRPRVSPHNLANETWTPPRSPKHETDENNASNTLLRPPHLQHSVTSSPSSPGHDENRPMAAPQSVASQTHSPLSPEHEKDMNISRNTHIRTKHLEHTVRSRHVSPAHVEKRPRASPQRPANRRCASPESPEHEKDWYVSENTHIRTPHLKHTVRSSHISPSHTEDRSRTASQSPATRRCPPLSPEYEKHRSMTRNTHIRISHLEHTVTSRHISPAHFENSPSASPHSSYNSLMSAYQTRSPPKSPEQEKYRHRHIRRRISPTYNHNHNIYVYKYSRSRTPERYHSRRYLPRPRPRCDRKVQLYCNSTAYRRPDRLPRYNHNR